MAKVKTEQSVCGFCVCVLFRRRWPVRSCYYKAIMYCIFHPAMTTGSVSIVLLIFIGDKGDLFIFVLADQNVRLWVSLFLWMLVAVHPFLLSSRRSAHCR